MARTGRLGARTMTVQVDTNEPVMRPQIVAEVSAQWSWAASAAKIPQIAEIVVTVPADIEHATVTVTVRDADIEFGSATVYEGPLEAGTSSVSCVHVQLSPRAMSQVVDRTSAVCEIVLRDTVGNIVLTRRDEDIHVQPRDLWFWLGDPHKAETVDRLAVRLGEIDAFLARDESGADDLLAEKDQIEFSLAMLTGQAMSLANSLLASFVRPNHPEVAAIARDAADEKGRATGEPSFSAFQIADVAKAEKAVDDSVAAVFAALRSRNIAYSEPPPNWDYATSGQRIRDHADVARSGLGTCMDTTVLMAAVFEHVGLYPVLVLVPGHIFVGYWRRDPDSGDGPRPQWYPDRPCIRNQVRIAELVQGGWLGAIESTMLATGSEASFADATRSAHQSLIQAIGEGTATLIDVFAARRAGVSPLPVVTERADGVTEIVEYRPGGERSITHVDQDSPERALRGRLVDNQPTRYRRWKGSLFSLNATNDLLNLKKNARVQPLMVPSESLGYLEDKLHEDVSFGLHSGYDIPDLWQARGIRNAVQMHDSPDTELRDELTEHLRQRRLYVQRIAIRGGTGTVLEGSTFVKEIRSMAYAAKTARDEQGMNPLFLCIGLLRWPYKPGVFAEAPMILVPVTIGVARGRTDFTLTIDSSQSTTPNSALIEWLRREHGIVVPELETPITDHAGLDVDAVLGGARTAIARAGAVLEVSAEARLALLDLSSFRMWQDLNAHADDFLRRPLINHLVHTPTEQFLDQAAVACSEESNLSDVENLQTPIPADSTQKQAVVWARQGRTFVLQGPPGTGKSQTITNMVAECLLTGLRVLFVAEKGTALSVVQRRLDQIGLGPFTLNLHHEGSNATQVRAHLRQSLDAMVHPDQAAMDDAQRRLRAADYGLREYPEQLHRVNAAGVSAYRAHDQLLLVGDGPAIAVPEHLVATDGRTVASLRSVFVGLQPWTAAARVGPDHPWRLAGPMYPDFDVTGAVDSIVRVLDSVAWCSTTTGSLRDYLYRFTEPEHLAVLAAATHPRLPAGPDLAGVLDPSWPRYARESSATAEQQIADAHRLLAGFSPGVVELDIDTISAAVGAASESKRWGRSKRLAEVIEPLTKFAPAGVDLADAAQAVRVIAQLKQARDLESVATATLCSVPGLADAVPTKLLGPQAMAPVHSRIGDFEQLTAPLRVSDEWVHAACSLAQSGALTGVRHQITDFATALQSLLRHLNADGADIGAWRGGRSIVATVAAHADTWRRSYEYERLLGLQQWMRLQERLRPLSAAGMDRTRIDILEGRLNAAICEDAFERGVARTSEAERVRALGLDRFDSVAHNSLVDTYARAQNEIRDQWVSWAPSMLLHRRGAGGRGSATGALARELEKTRQKLGTRALLRKYAPAVQQLAPLLLCSPSSVVDLIEPGAMEFDLVIFDEASQITVPEAIGALGRARAAIVVGDSKQMPPTKVVAGSALSEEELDDEAEEIIEDQESILSECELARVPTISLAWHYRSQDEALIAFSNAAYYRGALSSFPTPTLMSTETGVEFRHVDGHYLRAGSRSVDLGGGIVAGNNTNPVEAQAIVNAVHDLVRGSSTPPSIGIVTFNEQQRQLISDLLTANEDPAVIEVLDDARMGAGDVLFVKALEQVQGDERDTIIFSIAFSKQANGRIPTNFGPLSNSGGERRLNVAVTRARRKNVVYCSFDPAELDVSGATYQGPKDLKNFLTLAKSSADSDADSSVGARGDRQVLRDRHRDEIAAALRSAGLHVMTDVGLSNFRLDLVLARPARPDRPLLPVLLDGESWHLRNTVSDRDILPIDVLTALMGWPHVARIWWPMWLQNRDLVIEQIRAAVDAAEAGFDSRESAPTSVDTSAAQMDIVGQEPPADRPRIAYTRQVRSSTADVDVDVADTTSATPVGVRSVPDGPETEPVRVAETGHQQKSTERRNDDCAAEPADRQVSEARQPTSATAVPTVTPGDRFIAADDGVVGDHGAIDTLPDRAAVKIVRAELRDIIATEGPVATGRLIRIVARRHGLNRVPASRQEAIKAVLRSLVPSESYLESATFGDFVWPDHIDPAAWSGFRIGGGDRSFEDIAPEEIANAMCSIRLRSPGIADEALLRETAVLFDITRLGAKVRARLEDVRDRHLAAAARRV
ncbi:hypothetical protein GOAMR_62_00320 [Gordonia amarae NBRC 15530]|uniref:Uncharacterized protein n=3 Tax=Gordonia amarae TaxID=36821 RepID=G7GU52_9ACTN|nr:hypothetical protein GOAMR_62_00320 [Gordonia amarae NBRC 15530]